MKHLFVSVSVKQNLFVSVFVHKCWMMLNDADYTTLQNFCHANEQLSVIKLLAVLIREVQAAARLMVSCTASSTMLSHSTSTT